jgi:peptidoglycan/xylan/chitin deacetylase (PgdA/CDA1 family)
MPGAAPTPFDAHDPPQAHNRPAAHHPTKAGALMTDPGRRADAGRSIGYVALTFDDGPNANTPVLLAALLSSGVRATMFNTGANALSNPSLVAAEAAGGMWIGNHSFSHPHMLTGSPDEMRDELARTQRAIEAGGGGTPKLFRPPFGETDERLKSAAAGLSLLHVTWDVDSEDWNGASTEAIVAAADRLQDGGVMLMHDGYATTIAAIPAIVANLARRGLRPGMIDPATGRAVAPSGSVGGAVGS